MTITERYVFVLGYGVMIGNLDAEEGVQLYGGKIVEGRIAAERLCEQALRDGHEEADVYMLIPPNTFLNGGDCRQT